MDHGTRARSLFERGYYSASIDEAQLGMAGAPKHEQLELRLLAAMGLEKMRQHPPALGLLNRVLAEAPDHAQALAHRGSVYDRMVQRAQAKADLNRALELDPDYAHAWENLFYVSFDTGDNASCDRALENLERLGEEKGYFYRLRGARRLENGDRAGAETDLRRACHHKVGDPQAADVMSQAGMALQTGDEFAMFAVQRERDNPAAAIDNYNKALEIGVSTARRDMRCVERLAKLLSPQNRRDEAVAAAQGLTTRHPESAECWLARAVIDGETASFEKAYALSAEEGAVPYARHLLGAGRTQDALSVCQKRIEADADDAAALALLGDVQMALDSRDAAKAAWTRAEALGNLDAGNARRAAFGPEFGMDHFDAALDLLDRRLQQDAVAEFETAIDKLRKETRVPGDKAHRYLAKSLYNSAFLRELRVDDAIIEPNFREAAELDPFYPDVMNSLGTLCLRTGRVDEGLEWFAKAGEVDPSAGQPWFYRARHFSELNEHDKTVESATKAFQAYSQRGQGRFAADAVMLRGQANEARGQLQAAKEDYDLAYDYGHPTGFAMGDHIRQRLAIDDPSSPEASELLEKVIERLQKKECPWAEIDFVDARVAKSEKAVALVDKLKNKEQLEDEQTAWLVNFLKS